MSKDLIIKIEYGGLGDHLFFSHIPRIAKEMNSYDKVWYVGAFSEEVAEKRFAQWLEQKNGKIAAKEAKLSGEKEARAKARLEEEKKVNEAIAKKVAEKKAAAAAEKAAAEAEAAAPEAEAPAEA